MGETLESTDSRPITGTEGASFPFWSPDNHFIGFFSEGKLKKIDVAGGYPQTICSAGEGRGGTWNRDGKIIFAPGTNEPLYQVSAAGGTPISVTSLDKTRSETSHRWPYFLPDGLHFVYYDYTGTHKEDAIFVSSVNSKERKLILQSDSTVAYASSYLFFIRDSALMAQRFDPEKLQTVGEAFVIQENVGRYGDFGPFGYAPFSVSQNGLIAFSQIQPTRTQPIWVDRKGKELQTLGPTGFYSEPSLSPDGKRIAVAVSDAKSNNADIWILDLSRGTFSRLTFDNSSVGVPSWSPDGMRISYSSRRLGHGDIYEMLATGARSAELLLKSDADKWADDWTHDGRYIVYENFDEKGKFDLWLLPTFGDRKPFPILQTEFNESHVQISPDGKWMAYVSDETGRAEIFVRSFPNTTHGKWQISTEGGDMPQWSRDGRELFYISTADKKLMSAAVSTGPTFEVTNATALFEPSILGSTIVGPRNNYVASPDGQRFFMNKIAEQQRPSPITVVINWPAQLQR